jgi:hypothetical protein
VAATARRRVHADERADPPSRGLRRDRYQACRGYSRARLSRTAKPCGPGAPMLALNSWSAQRALQGRRGQKSPVPGESAE